jgi:hypothetical protein
MCVLQMVNLLKLVQVLISRINDEQQIEMIKEFEDMEVEDVVIEEREDEMIDI